MDICCCNVCDVFSCCWFSKKKFVKWVRYWDNFEFDFLIYGYKLMKFVEREDLYIFIKKIIKRMINYDEKKNGIYSVFRFVKNIK